jgi:hypothetical protein
MDVWFWLIVLPTGLGVWLTVVVCAFIVLRLGWLMISGKPRF